MKQMLKSKAQLAQYDDFINHFLRTGQCGVPASDPLSGYLAGLMTDVELAVQVMRDSTRQTIFRDMMLQLAQNYLDKTHFIRQRRQAEVNKMAEARLWTAYRRHQEGAVLLHKVAADYVEDGFPSAYCIYEMERPDVWDDEVWWSKTMDDWQAAFSVSVEKAEAQMLGTLTLGLDIRLRTYLNQIPLYLSTQEDGEEKVLAQVWRLMNGLWNTVDYERLRRYVRLQTTYPQLLDVARVMGRVADDEGNTSLRVSEQKDDYRVTHAAHSDVEGVTVGRDLNALLPMEMAQCVDDELSDVFLHKYLTGHLQMFRYQSHALSAARSMQIRRAAVKGPMIVCADTSGSMDGMPSKIVCSQLMKLLDMAERSNRDCYLIAFSVSAQPIDVRREKGRLMQFFASLPQGDTSATQMLRTTFQLLNTQPEYANADVLVVSDFRIPLPSDALLQQMTEHRERGTCFYGLQIGVAQHGWAPLLDHLYVIPYQQVRRF